MRHACIIVLLGIAVLAACSRGPEKPKEPQMPIHEKNDPLPPMQAGSSAGTLPQVTSLALSPEAPTVLDDIIAVAGLSDPEEMNAGVRYRWYVNGRETLEAADERLPKALFRKGAWIFCQARVGGEGGEGEWFKSETIRVRNSPPTLQLGPVDPFTVPGEFTYQAAASDPDNDALTFELVSPLDQGIVLDAKSGALAWPLSEAIVKGLGEQAEIKITVSDGEGKAEGTITLNFNSTRK